MNLSDAAARVRLNMKRCHLQSHGERPKQRRVLEDPDGDEVMIGETQEKLNMHGQKSQPHKFDDWQHKESSGKLKELQSQNDFMSMHEVPSSEAVNKEVIKTRWVLKQQSEAVNPRTTRGKKKAVSFHARTPTPVSCNLVLALRAKRVALGTSQTIVCLNVSTAIVHAEMSDEVCIKMDADTLRLIREEQLPNFHPLDNEGFYEVDKTLWILRLTTILERRCG